MLQYLIRPPNGAVTARKAPGSFDRVVPLERTLALVPSLRARFGITRIADTTRLQRIGVPTFSAIVPASKDDITVYNGKGLTREAALASAVMEAVERQVAASIGSSADVVLSLAEVQHHLDVTALGPRKTSPRSRVRCLYGIDMLTGDRLPVPLAVVAFPIPERYRFVSGSTNGLASGNDSLEAAYHAMMELIERHLWSLVHIQAHLWPSMLRTAFARLAAQAGLPENPPDDSVASEVLLPTGRASIDDLTQRIHEAGLHVRLLAYEEEPLPVGMFCAITDPDPVHPYVYGGFGCSWSPEHAAVRAMTEAVAARAVDIQGVREDYARESEAAGRTGFFAHVRGSKPAIGRWYRDGPAQPIRLDDLTDKSHDDLAAEFHLLLDAVRSFGAARVVLVDLTPPDLGCSVVRVVVPELERTLIDGSMTARARRLFGLPLPAPAR